MSSLQGRSRSLRRYRQRRDETNEFHQTNKIMDDTQSMQSHTKVQNCRVDRGNYNNTQLSAYCNSTILDNIVSPKGYINHMKDKTNSNPHRHIKPQSTLDSWRQKKSGDSNILEDKSDSLIDNRQKIRERRKK